MYRALPPPEHRYGLALQVTAPPAGELHVTMCTVLVGAEAGRGAGGGPHQLVRRGEV